MTVMVIPALGLDTPTATTVLGLPLMVALFGWMLSLARDLGAHARASDLAAASSLSRALRSAYERLRASR